MMSFIRAFIFQKASKDIQWSFLSLIFTAITYFIIRVLVGKELGTYGLGIYTLVFTIYIFFMQFASLGIGSSLTKYIAEFKDDTIKSRSYISRGIFISILAGLLLSVSLFLFSEIIAVHVFHNPDIEFFLKITALSIPFLALHKVALGIFNGLRRMSLFSGFSILMNCSILFFTVFLVNYKNWELLGAVLGFVIPTIIVGIFTMYYLVNTVKFPIRVYSLKDPILLEILIFGFFFVLSVSISTLNLQIDSLLIGYFLDPKEVGIYAVAVLIVQAMTLIPNAVQMVSYPAMSSKYGKRDYQGIGNIIKKSMFLTFLISFTIGISLIIFGNFLITFLFSNDFAEAFIPLSILILGYTIYAPILSIKPALASIGRIKLMFLINFIIVGLNILLNMFLIPKYGIIGAAIATSISLCSASLIFGLIFYRLIISKSA